MIQEISRREDRTVWTTVVYTFSDGSTKEVEIPHFNPSDEEEIQLGISNRFITEQRSLDKNNN